MSILDSETMSKLSTVDMISRIERILKIFSSSLFSDRTITIHSSRRRKKCWTNCPYKDEECSTVFESNQFVWSGGCCWISWKLQTIKKKVFLYYVLLLQGFSLKPHWKDNKIGICEMTSVVWNYFSSRYKLSEYWYALSRDSSTKFNDGQ